MKPAPFSYVRARSVAEALDLLAEHGSEARILAGGQSLLPMLALRVSSPALLIDIGAIGELRFVDEADGVVRIGALARHADLHYSTLVAARLPLVARAMPHLAHAAIRNRGTLGGSLALADPAAQLPACMFALQATMVVASRAGERRVAAQDFFTGLYATDLRPDELLVRVEIPPTPAGTRAHYAQVSRRRGDFAMVGLAALRLPGGLPESLRLVYLGCGDRPLQAARAQAVLASGGVERRARLMQALEADLSPSADLRATPQMRLHLAAVLAERAVAELCA